MTKQDAPRYKQPFEPMEKLLTKPAAKILILDDDPLTMDALRLVLSGEFEVHGFTRPEAAEIFLSHTQPEAALLDLNFPHHNGISLLRAWKEKFPALPIISCSGEVKVERAMECLRHGASDYLVKPFHGDDLLRVVRRTLEKKRLAEAFQSGIETKETSEASLVGNSQPLTEMLSKLRLLRNQTHLNVLILGESGTGKELVARLLHRQEKSSKRPFIVANMPAIPANLMEAEFFGVEKGAYTDAKVARAGKFEQADGGDIFLDEIGDLPFETQAKILRTLQERQVERIGSSQGKQISFRAIAATNRPLADLIAGGSFREDLMYRLSDMVLWLPALRERIDDIPALVAHFLRKYRGENPPDISDSALAKLMAYHWPGNVRQLESTLKRALIFNPGSVLKEVEIFDPSTLNPLRIVPEANLERSYEAQLSHFERTMIINTLRRHGGDRSSAIEELQVSKATFYRKISQLKIPLAEV